MVVRSVAFSIAKSTRHAVDAESARNSFFKLRYARGWNVGHKQELGYMSLLH